MTTSGPDVQVLHGDCLDVLRDLPDSSVDAVITDPPYGLSNAKPAQIADTLTAWATGDDEHVPAKRGGFMGKDWDSFVPPPAVWKECLRVLKPGGHMAVFAGARTQDLMGMSIRLAGFDVRDNLAWIYGSGFPKGQDIGKQIDKRMGAEREVIGTKLGRPGYSLTDGNGDHRTYSPGLGNTGSGAAECEITAPATPEARQWDGWNSQLKPAHEPIILAQKPFKGSLVDNVLAHGVGGLNIDACRVDMSDADRENARVPQPAMRPDGEDSGHALGAGKGRSGDRFDPAPAGRFPANVVLDKHAANALDQQSGILTSGANPTRRSSDKFRNAYGDFKGQEECAPARGVDSGGASRFFHVFKYQAKAPKRERPVVEREPMLRLRDDLTPEQVDHVRARLREVGTEIG